jgi:phenylacetate-CoA ligase
MDQHRLKPSDITRAEDSSKLPVLTRDIVRREGSRLIARNISEMTIGWTKTGGTTGEPMRICKNRECTAWSSMCHERGLKWGGKLVDEPVIRLAGGSLGIDRTSVTTRIGKTLRGDVFIPAFDLHANTVGSYFEQIRRSKSCFVTGYASAIYRLASLAKDLHQNIKFTAVFPTAELLLPEWEEMIRTTFDCLVLPYYGCGEVNALGFSAPQYKGYFIPEEHALIEVMQNDNVPQLYGDGRFLVTDLDNYAMPIVRYANGDAGKTACADGRLPFSRIVRLDGRCNSFLITDKGDLISGAFGAHLFRHTTSVQAYRIIQEEPLRIVIKIVPRNEFSQHDRRLIVDLFAKHLGNRMKIAIEEVSDLPVPPSGKSVFVVNHCLSH